ncbi:DNA-binding transcriptional regulator, MarR family [Pelosinus propionicus DSM 13327]|uniref:DNA-binding transcriptional regulator, MarR family n=2 Tax=Pelosinus TaxID=365348 RepID=A0A1I4NU86_9FIRM|nr:DNA-binding transcriptional regulator, MarR family [Pelosinus propionicus DSM 13327]
MAENNSWTNRPFSYLFRAITFKMKNKADKSLSEYGLTSQQGQTIGYINSNEGVIQKDLADFFNKRDATMTSMLQGLEKKGFIERKIPENNEREKRVYLRPMGKELVGSFDKKFQEIEDDITKSLTDDEIETLLRLLTKINNNLE